VCNVAPSCWNHTVACVFPTKFPCKFTYPWPWKPLHSALLYITQHKNVSLRCQILYNIWGGINWNLGHFRQLYIVQWDKKYHE
jgi:hypothetical protein